MQESQEFGKSTITNKILGNMAVKTGEISEKIKRGKNTTTDISLYEVEKDTYLLDTPGFQTLDIYEIESKDLAEFFIDFLPYIKNCKYVGCSHVKEDNCGIKEALENRKNRTDKIRKLC